MATLQADLQLNISAALAEIGQLESALDEAVSAETVNLTVDADTGEVTGAVESAVDAADSTVNVEADAADVTSSVDSAVDAADSSVSVEADTAGVTASVEAAVDAADTAVTVDTTQAEESVGGLSDLVSGGLGGSIRQVAALVGGGALVGGFVSAGVEYNTLLQTSQAALTTLLGSASRARQVLGDITDFASSSPFPRQLFIEATQQMLAFGFAAEDVVPTLSAVQDAVATAGGSADDISEIVFVLSQVQSTGKITAETLNQLGFRGVNAARIIAEQMGTTENDIRESITNGTLDAREALEALTAGLTENFGGAAEGVKETFVGALDSVKAAIRDTSSVFLSGIIDPAGGGVGVESLNVIADQIRSLEPLAATLGGTLAEVGGETTRLASAFASELTGAINQSDDALAGFETTADGVALVLGLLADGTERAGRALGESEEDASLFDQGITAATDSAIRSLPVLGQLYGALELVGVAGDVAGETLEKGFGEAGFGEEGDRLREEAQETSAEIEAFTESVVGALPKAADSFSQLRAASADLAAGFGILNAESDPSVLAANLAAQAQAISEFTTSLTVIADAGFADVAALFAEQGPEVAAGYARAVAEAALAGDDSLAEAVESGLVQLEGASSVAQELANRLGVEVGGAVPEAAAGAIGEGAGAAESAGVQVGEAAAQGVDSGLETAGGLVAAQVALIASIVLGSGAQVIGAALTTGQVAGRSLGSGFASSVLPPVTVAFALLRSQVVVQGASLSLTAYTSGASVGRALGSGIAAGIGEQISAITKAARQAVSEAAAAARAEAKASSPSRVFAEIGADMGEGLAIGFADAARQLVAEAEAVTFAAAQAPSSTLAAVSASSGGVGGVQFGGVDVRVQVYGDATPETAAAVRDGAREGTEAALAAQQQRFDALYG